MRSGGKLESYHFCGPREVVVREHDALGGAGSVVGVHEGAALIDGNPLDPVLQPLLRDLFANLHQLIPGQDVLLKLERRKIGSKFLLNFAHFKLAARRIAKVLQ